MSYIVEYYSKVKDKEIIIGHELRLMLDQVYLEVTDPIYQNLHKIRFNPDESEKRIKFIETKCKHYEAPHAGKPFILEIWQKAFIEAIFAIQIYDEELGRYVRKYKEVLFLVGRKNGKTPLIGAVCLSEWFCGEMGKKILCVDDAAFMRKMVKDTLSKAGYTDLYEAVDGADAVEKFGEISPDLVIMDITMPNMDGLEALKAIRAADGNANVVMCSAMGQETMVIDAIKSGAKDFIVKPFKIERVLKTVTSIVGEP